MEAWKHTDAKGWGSGTWGATLAAETPSIAIRSPPSFPTLSKTAFSGSQTSLIITDAHGFPFAEPEGCRHSSFQSLKAWDV